MTRKHLAIAIILVLFATLATIWLLPSRPKFQRHDDLIGKSIVDVDARFGPSDHEWTWSPADGLGGEEGIEIFNTYPPDERSAGVTILERIWIDGDYRTVIYFHRPNGDWIVLGGYTHHKSIAF